MDGTFRARIASCEACDLCGSMGVPGEAVGNSPPTVMVIGEAPGYQEHVSGRPFVGQSGQLLRGWLKRGGLEDVYITNVIKHWPGLGNPDPTDKQVASCAPFLEEEIAAIKPAVLILVGRFAAKLAFKGPMKKIHGRFGYYKDTPCVAMYHPAFVLRRRGKERPSFEELEGDCLSILLGVKQYLGATGSPVTGVNSSKEPERGFDSPRLHQSPAPIALDFETSSLDPRTCKILASATQNGWRPKADCAELAFPYGHVVMHHACFDAPILSRCVFGGMLPKRIDDTMLIARDLGHADVSLKGLSSRILGEPCRSYNDVAQGRAAADIPLDELGPYCQHDAELTRMLYDKLYREGELTAYETIDRPLIPILVSMTLNGGFWIDRKGLQDYQQELEDWLAGCTSAAYSIAGKEFNVNSGDQLAHILFDELGLPQLGGKTKSGKRGSVDEKTLVKLVNFHPLAGVVMGIREKHKELSTFVLPWLEGGEQLTTIFEFGTDTGRLSSHNPNLLNVPKALRRFLKAAPGKVLVMGDYSQIEYRVAAHLSGDEAMLKAFRDGEDLHSYTARMLFGESTEENRRYAKVFNFGVLLYLGGPENIAEKLGVSRARGAQLARAGRDAYPGYYNWAERTIAETRERGYSEGLWGRRRYLSFLDDEQHAGRQAVNAPIQGGAADIVKNAMNKLDKGVLELDGRWVNQVYDEIIFEVDEERADEGVQLMREVCLRENPLDVPIDIDIVVRNAWGQSKNGNDNGS